MKKIIIKLLAVSFFFGLGLPRLSFATEVGTNVHITGTIIRVQSYVTADNAEVTRYNISRPYIDGQYVRSAWLKACTGPSADACQSAGLEMVSITPGVGLGSKIDAYGLITTISRKRYYSTYYLDATADIAPIN